MVARSYGSLRLMRKMLKILKSMLLLLVFW